MWVERKEDGIYLKRLSFISYMCVAEYGSVRYMIVVLITRSAWRIFHFLWSVIVGYNRL